MAALTVDDFTTPDIIAETVEGITRQQYTLLWDLLTRYEREEEAWADAVQETWASEDTEIERPEVPIWQSWLTEEQKAEINAVIAADPSCCYDEGGTERLSVDLANAHKSTHV